MKFVRRLLPYIVLVVVVADAGVVYLRRESILDWFTARDYQPSAVVKQLVTDDTMTPYATRLFYANRPAVEEKETFNKHCTDPSEQVAVLGCFTGNRQGIFVFDINDPRIDGIEQVTAAHEMLHQAYQRLGGAEKTRINGLLQAYHDLTASQALKDKIASYKDSEPDQLLNEMHSIFGTEAPDLPPELETYYKQYFDDRQKILAFHKQYQSEFDGRRDQIAAYDAQLTSLKDQIEASKADLEAQEALLITRRKQLDAYVSASQIPQYNAAVPSFNALVNKYRKDLNTTNRLVDQFNVILAERNSIAVQERQLEAAIDSTVDAAQSH